MKDTIQLTAEEAIAFVALQKRYAFIQLLESLDAFGIKNGSVTIHFDAIGAIRSVEKHQHYKT